MIIQLLIVSLPQLDFSNIDGAIPFQHYAAPLNGILDSPDSIKSLALKGEVTKHSVDSFIREFAPELISRYDVQVFLKARTVKLRKMMLKTLYAHGCIEWKLLGRIAKLAKENNYI